MTPGTHPGGEPRSSYPQGARGHPGTRIWSPPAPQETEGPTKELTPVEVSTEEAAPTEEPTEVLAVLMAMVSELAEESGIPPAPQEIEGPTKELIPTEVSMEEVAPTEEPREELATPMAMVSEQAEESGIPPLWHEEREKGGSSMEQHSLAGQRCCILPGW